MNNRMVIQPTSDQCEQARAEYHAIEIAVERLQDEVGQSAGVFKYALLARIYRLMREAGQLQAQFEACGDLSSGDF
jgi:hypothetical protein